MIGRLKCLFGFHGRLRFEKRKRVQLSFDVDPGWATVAICRRCGAVLQESNYFNGDEMFCEDEQQ